MSPRRNTVTELAFVLPLLVLPGIPLLASTVCDLPAWALGLDATVFLLLATCWCRFARGGPVETPLAPDPARRAGLAGRLRPIAVPALLLGLTLVAYFVPMVKHFWGGYDEHAGFAEGCAELWSRTWDTALARPTLGWVAVLSRALTPDSLDGFLWVGAALCWLNACLLYAVLRRLVPQVAGVAVLAAVLLVVSRADPSRFFVLWTANFYLMALFLLLASLWVLVLSRQSRSRALLLVACGLLAAALLTSEGLYPLALSGLAAIAITRREGPNAVVWAAAWLGTIALLAARFLLAMSVKGWSDSYQGRQTSGVLQDPRRLWEHLLQRAETFGQYLEHPRGWVRVEHLGAWFAAFALAAACAWLGSTQRSDGRTPAPSGRGLVLGVCAGVAAFLLGAAPFLHLANTFRTMFFAAPGQAVAAAFGASLLVAWMAPRWRRLLLAAGIGFLAAEATVISAQSQSDLQLGDRVHLDHTIRVYEQVRAVTAGTDPLVLFVVEEGATNPLSDLNYANWGHARAFLNGHAYLANVDFLGQGPVFTDAGVAIPHHAPPQSAFFPYESVVAFRLASDGTLSFLPRLPASLLPGVHAEGYDPLAHLRAGPIAPLHHLRSRYADSDFTDVVDARRGVVLTGDWLPLRIHGQHVFRWARNGAGFVVNTAVATGTLDLDLEPGGPLADLACELRVTDAQDQVVLRMPILGRRTVSLPLPAASEGLATLRLWLDAGPGAAVPAERIVYRITRRAAGVGRLQAARDAADIFEDQLTPLRNWRPLIVNAGRKQHRWLEDEAEVITGARVTTGLEVTLEPGRSTPERPCRVTLEDDAGNALATADLTSRLTVHLVLPSPVGPGTLLRLRSSAECDALPGQRPAWSARCFRVRSRPHGD